MKSLKLGIVGAGRMAREHSRAFADVPGVELAGIASRTVERAEEVAREFSIAKVYESSAGLIAGVRPDILVVAVPEPATVPVMRELIGKSAAILVEKPVGIDLADCRTVAGLAQAAGAPVFVGLNRRSYGSTRAALEALAGDAGSRFIEVHDQEDVVAARKAGRPEEVVRNWMFANSIHIIDYFHIFGRGAIVNVNVVDAWTGAVPTQVIAHVTFSSGDTGLYCAVWNKPGPWSCAVTTAAHRVEMRPMEQCRVQTSGSRQFEEIAQDAWDRDFKAGFRRQAQETIDFVRRGDRPAHVPDIAEALATTELVARLYGLPV